MRNNDIVGLLSCLDTFSKATSARINWNKCSSLLLGNWGVTPPPRLPQQCVWEKGGFKILGVFLGSDTFLQKNWEGLLDKVKGRLHRWRWLLPQLSYRGRALIVNNLAASMLWHRVTVLQPPRELIGQIQKEFVNFFWDGHHWLPPGVLHLPLCEGGQGLIHAQSKVDALRLQSLQRLLYSSESAPWIPFGRAVLRGAAGGALDRHWALMDSGVVQNGLKSSSPFYCSVFKIWGLFRRARGGHDHFGIEEPLFHNTFWPHSKVFRRG